ncbi:TIGR04141 family sporadically distributed protein [Achromobacter sp. 2789STDY5608621]|uniref:TIGR04141 family sporadically distributed protein n=1 Tax=Achromobacter sp. 2789STDY5608621 TaxID=1806496 RepID=UPI001E305CA6|nr:TIGR04141 family sporadically distributed protein [Achromobacter sp. 2789STDY5608621]
MLLFLFVAMVVSEKAGMSMAKVKKEKLSIYLAKDRMVARADLIKMEDSQPPALLLVAGETVEVYVKKDIQRLPPSWTKLFTNNSEMIPEDFGGTRNVGAVAIFERMGRLFLLSFGSGYHLLKLDGVERDFGLRVTLASVDADKLRSVDKASYDANPLNSRTQSTTEVDIFELQMDSELEMLYAITGASRVPLFGSHVTGRDALTIAVSTDLGGIPPILDEALRRYNSPLPSEFEWVDNIRKVKDPEIISVLDACLNDELAAPTSTYFWLGEPEVVDWEDQIGYSFDMYANTPRSVVLKMEDLIDYLQRTSRVLSVDVLKGLTVHINNSNYESTRSWSAYRCLYAELVLGAERYMLRNGVWFQAEPSFVALIDDYISKVDVYPFSFPVYGCDREDEYNEMLARNDPCFALMDKKNTKLGGRYDKIEFCDLIRDGTDLIHVKYYRSSGTLSHLFAQGFVAAEAFVRDVEFREKLNEKLPDSMRLADPQLKPKANDFNIVFAIATTKTLPRDLPFFSKVTLRNALKTLIALDYKVQLATIDVDPFLIAKKKCKPKKGG